MLTKEMVLDVSMDTKNIEKMNKVCTICFVFQ